MHLPAGLDRSDHAEQRLEGARPVLLRTEQQPYQMVRHSRPLPGGALPSPRDVHCPAAVAVYGDGPCGGHAGGPRSSDRAIGAEWPHGFTR